MEIPEINTNNISIRSLDIPKITDWSFNQSVIPSASPVTVYIGVPIVDVPGCVEAHETNNPKNDNLTTDDKRGTLTFCDSGYPSFNPINFEPEQIIPTSPAPIQTRSPETKTPKLDLPKEASKPIPSVAQPICPTRAQELKNPIGTILQGNKKIVGYELVGKECIEVTENLDIPQQIINNIPNAGMVTTTSTIAVVATTSALMAKPLADILLKVLKPAIKKILKKVSKIRGKEPEILSVKERQDLQRSYSHALRSLKGKE